MAHCAHCGSYVDQVSNVPCASCGKPTNGAPPRVIAGAGGSSAAVVIVGVVIGGLVVIAIIGILAAIAIPNLISAMQHSRQKRTVADIRTASVALEAYRNDNGSYPRVESADDLRSALVPDYLASVPATDGWGNELRYRCIDESCSGFAISSSGSDRIFEHVTANEYERKATTKFDCDIVLVNGELVQYPAQSGGEGD